MRNRICDFGAVDVYLNILTDFATGSGVDKNYLTALASTNHEAILVLELHPIGRPSLILTNSDPQSRQGAPPDESRLPARGGVTRLVGEAPALGGEGSIAPMTTQSAAGTVPCCSRSDTNKWRGTRRMVCRTTGSTISLAASCSSTMSILWKVIGSRSDSICICRHPVNTTNARLQASNLVSIRYRRYQWFDPCPGGIAENRRSQLAETSAANRV